MQSGKIEDWLAIIKKDTETITNKYTAIFQLRQFENIEAARALIEGFESLKFSDLLQHEVTYALGQMKIENNDEIKQFLQNCFEDESQYPVVRHESGEGLSNFAEFFELVPLFSKYQNDKVEEVRDTAILALKKAETYKQLKDRYGVAYMGTREPAAPFNTEEIEQLLNEKLVQNQELQFSEQIFKKIPEMSLWEQYRSLYFLRDLSEKVQSQQIVKLIAELLLIKNLNNLYRHEICFVLGQVGHLAQLTENIVKQLILDANENHIVRHEAISAFQGVSKDRDLMKQFFEDPAPIVKHSAIVAYEMIDYWNL